MAARKGFGALVFGGGSGLGLATGKRLVKNGYKVVLADLPSSEGDRVARDLGDSCIFAPADVSSESSVKQAIKTVVDKCGPLRAVVNTAGIMKIAGTLSDTGEAHSLSLFEEITKINLTGSFNVARLAAEQMATNEPDEGGERGVIINTSSVHAYEGQAGKVAYSATKGAINGMFLTPMFTKGRPEPSQQESAAQIIPFPKRIADPEDFAHLALSIIENRTINGEIIRIDGAVRMP
ncbi:3-hydroxyacyl-CoA dehydrogenase type-2-like isoform X2 [Porites lutea]|uniref:3-hydroxyacyl-CoA dehydrogenase type-2-like isoform X2 n=1 Tax=Porites lutea TaxID=51062 RepID=UPI003CC5B015